MNTLETQSSVDYADSLKDSLLGAGIALIVSIGVLSHLTVRGEKGLILMDRWHVVAVAVAIVFVGRFLLNILFWKRKGSSGVGSLLKGHFDKQKLLIKSIAEKTGLPISVPTVLAILMVAFAIFFPLFSFADRYVLDVAILVLTYVMLGWGLNIVVGLAGLLDLGYVAFYAVGAYAYALLAAHFGLSFWICLPLAGIMAAFWGILLGFPVLRLRGDYLAIVTLAFGEIIRVVLLNWYQFTGGPDGLSGIPRPSFFGLEFKRFGDGTFADFFGLEYSSLHRIIFLYYLILILALITNYVTLRLRKLPIGRAWEALREDEIACRSLGVNTTNTKLTAFAIGAMFGGFAGAFFATRQGFISPESFTFIESAIILAIVVLGGMGSQIGVAIAAVVMIGGFEYLRDPAGIETVKLYLGKDFDPSQYRMLLYGLAMVVIMVWRPRGLIASRAPSIVLKERKAISGSLVKEGEG